MKKKQNTSSKKTTTPQAVPYSQRVLKYQNILFQTDDSIPSLPLPNCCSICYFGMSVAYPELKGSLVNHNCKGNVCLNCLQKSLKEQYENNKNKPLCCPLCDHQFTDDELYTIYPELQDEIDAERKKKHLQETGGIQCRFCPNIYYPYKDTYVETTYEGRQLTPEQIECCRINYRCCPNCGITSCAECGSVPYHLGETCKEHKWFVEGYVCRICGRPANPSSNKKRALLVCNNPECQEKASQMCKEIHLCGHACCGCACDGSHPLCPLCTVGGSLCPHCRKPLWGELCYRLSCGHTIHKNCALELLKLSSQGPELKLPICPAPGCGAFVWHPDLEQIAHDDIERWHKIMDLVEEVITARILAEGIRFHPDVASKLNEFAWAGDDAARNWAKKKMRFMICYKHNPPCVYTDARLEDPPANRDYNCPLCPEYKYPICDTCGYMWMQNKCQCCCSVGVRHSTMANEFQRGSGNNLWYCEICRELPHKSQDEKCKGNCKFAPHPNTAGNFYAYCAKCNKVYTKPRHFMKLIAKK